MGSVCVGGHTGPHPARGQKQRAGEWAWGPCPVHATSGDTFCWGAGSAHAAGTRAAVLFGRHGVPGLLELRTPLLPRPESPPALLHSMSSEAPFPPGAGAHHLAELRDAD